MRTPGVVKLEPRGDADVRLAAVSIALQVDVLVFEGAPQSLDEHVVHPSAAAVHRDAHTGGRQRGGEGGTGKLTALGGIEDLWSAKARERLLKRRGGECAVHGVLTAAMPAPHGSPSP